jgi:hypothetical protein
VGTNQQPLSFKGRKVPADGYGRGAEHFAKIGSRDGPAQRQNLSNAKPAFFSKHGEWVTPFGQLRRNTTRLGRCKLEL